MDPNPSPDKKEDQQIIIRSAAVEIIRRSEELKCVSLPYRLAGQGKLSNFLIYHIFQLWKNTPVIPIKFMFAQRIPNPATAWLRKPPLKEDRPTYSED